MSDETIDLDLETDLESVEEQKQKRQDIRIKDLANKTTVAVEAQKKAETEKDVALKEANFYKNFNPLVTKYPGSAEYQDKIKEKVMAGYEVEDAAVAILAKEGKLNQQAAIQPKENPAGGSAINAIQAGGSKSLNEMSREERKAALMDAIAKGEISVD